MAIQAQPLTAQFAAGRQVAQPSQFQITQGPGMSGGQVADYLRGNALNIGQQMNGQNAVMRNVDPAADVRARDRFTEAMTQTVYDADQAMQRQKMDLEGRMAMADSQNALTKELGYARMKSAEDMQRTGIEGQKEILNIQLTDKEKDRVEDARKFDTRQAWMEKAKQLDLDDNEADRVWRSLESDKQIASAESEGDKNREVQEKKLESQERIAFGQIANQLKIAGMEDETRNRIADMANKIDEAKIGIMEAEIGLGYDQLAEKKRQFDGNIDLQYAELDAEMQKADDANKRMLEIAKIQLEGTKYNVDKSFELKSLERQDKLNMSQNMQPVIDDMFRKHDAWKEGGGRREFEKEVEVSYLISNANSIDGFDMQLVGADGNINETAYKTALQLAYADKDFSANMQKFITSQTLAMDQVYTEMLQNAFKYKNLYPPVSSTTTAPSTAPNALQGQGGGNFGPAPSPF